MAVPTRPLGGRTYAIGLITFLGGVAFGTLVAPLTGHTAVWTAVSGLGTLVATAFSAQSARASRTAVEEMRIARLESSEPLLSYSLPARTFTLAAGPKSALGLAVYGGTDEGRAVGIDVDLHNFGSTPALNVRLLTRVVSDLSLEDRLDRVAALVGPDAKARMAGPFLWIDAERSFGIAVRREEPGFLMHCAGNEATPFKAPSSVLHYALLLAALQVDAAREDGSIKARLPDLPALELQISYQNIRGETKSQIFHLQLTLGRMSLGEERTFQFVIEDQPTTAGVE